MNHAALVLPGLADIDDDQQGDHHHEEQGGQGVDLRADPLLGHGIDDHGQGGEGGAGGEVADHEVVDGHSEGDEQAVDHAGP